MQSRIMLFIAALLMALPFHQQAQNNLQQQLNQFNEPIKTINCGVAAMLHQNGKTETASLGTYQLNEHSVFNIGSATKTFTAILILQEMEKGNLKLTDKVSEYFSNLPNVNGNITIEQLLRHESGLGEIAGQYFEQYFFDNSDSTYSCNFLFQIPEGDTSQIGVHDYCNTNYILLGHILERITDQKYFDLLRTRIFDVCEMTESYPYVSKHLPNLAHPTKDGKDVVEHMHHRFFADYAFAAGSIASTLADMKKFYLALYETNQLLQPASFAQMQKFNDGDYGFGLYEVTIDSVQYIGHGGNNLGYAFKNYYNPKTKMLLLYFANSYNLPFRKEICDDALAYAKGEKSTTKLISTQQNPYAQHLGNYLLEAANMEMELRFKTGNYYLEVQGAELLLVSTQANQLKDLEFGIQLTFDANNTKIISFNQRGMKAVIKKTNL